MDSIFERCRDCIYLYEGDGGEWMCDHMETECDNVPDENCPVENSHEEGSSCQ